MTRAGLVLGALLVVSQGVAQGEREMVLHLARRTTNAPTGSELARTLAPLGLAARERTILAQVQAGNVPDFIRQLRPVQISETLGGATTTAEFFVTPDYLAVGSDEDYLLMPLTPGSAQMVADALECSLPTRKMVDAIYRAAELKLTPTPVPPSPAMTSVPVFLEHNDMVKAQRDRQLDRHPRGVLTAGHKKDIVISPKLAGTTNTVAIYGWHQPDGEPIQPLYMGHSATWADYSHGVRLVHKSVRLNGKSTTLAAVLADPSLCALLSDEGPIQTARYSTGAYGSRFGEQTRSLTVEPEVK